MLRCACRPFDLSAWPALQVLNQLVVDWLEEIAALEGNEDGSTSMLELGSIGDSDNRW